MLMCMRKFWAFPLFFNGDIYLTKWVRSQFGAIRIYAVNIFLKNMIRDDLKAREEGRLRDCCYARIVYEECRLADNINRMKTSGV